MIPLDFHFVNAYNSFLEQLLQTPQMPTFMNPIYADSNASTRLDSRVCDEMNKWFLGPPANAGSRTHTYGRQAKQAVEESRVQIAVVLDAKPEEIIFTSSATEANNIAILGLERHGREQGKTHILSTAIEHKAVLEPLMEMRRRGFDVDLLPVSERGTVDPELLKARLRNDTLLVSVMHANNETGILQPIEKIGEIIRNTDVLFHTDAAQTFGKEIQPLRKVGAHFISISGHKIYGPQGIGALFVRKNATGKPNPLNPIQFGGGQERGLRPGTLPVALIAGLGKASELALKECDQRHRACQAIRSKLLEGLAGMEFQINGNPSISQNHVLNIRFCGVDGEALILALQDDLAFSNGSACTSASYEPSHVLKAMGFDDQHIAESVRISWDHTVEKLPLEAMISEIKKLTM